MNPHAGAEMSETRKVKRYADPNDPLNGEKYHTGKPCVEGCGRPAGTHWSPLWCHPCNVVRMDRISASLASLAGRDARAGA